MADRQPVAGMGERRDIDGKAAVAVAQDLARAEAVAPGGVLDRVAVGVGEAQRPVARRRRARSDAIETAPIERTPGAVDVARRASGLRRAPAESRRCAPARRAYRGRLRASAWRRRATRRSHGAKGGLARIDPLAATPSARPIAPAGSGLKRMGGEEVGVKRGARRCRRARRASGPRRARAEFRRCAPARRACRGRLRASPPWRRRATPRSSRRRTAGRRGSIRSPPRRARGRLRRLRVL